MNNMPEWIMGLEEDELKFIKRFMLCSGSLKDLAKQYNVTYPTLRLRLNKVIKKIGLLDKEQDDDPYVRKIKLFAIDNKIDVETAKILINEYKEQLGRQKK